MILICSCINYLLFLVYMGVNVYGISLCLEGHHDEFASPFPLFCI